MTHPRRSVARRGAAIGAATVALAIGAGALAPSAFAATPPKPDASGNCPIGLVNETLLGQTLCIVLGSIPGAIPTPTATPSTSAAAPAPASPTAADPLNGLLGSLGSTLSSAPSAVASTLSGLAGATKTTSGGAAGGAAQGGAGAASGSSRAGSSGATGSTGAAGTTTAPAKPAAPGSAAAAQQQIDAAARTLSLFSLNPSAGFPDFAGTSTSGYDLPALSSLTSATAGSVPEPDVAGLGPDAPSPQLAPNRAATIAAPSLAASRGSELPVGLVAVAAVLLAGTAAGTVRVVFSRAH